MKEGCFGVDVWRDKSVMTDGFAIVKLMGFSLVWRVLVGD